MKYIKELSPLMIELFDCVDIKQSSNKNTRYVFSKRAIEIIKEIALFAEVNGIVKESRIIKEIKEAEKRIGKNYDVDILYTTMLNQAQECAANNLIAMRDAYALSYCSLLAERVVAN